MPGAYDYGPQLTSWMCSLITNWMGDARVLKRVRTEMRRFNIVGDTTFCKGKVVRKCVKDKTALVDTDIAAENQRARSPHPIWRQWRRPPATRGCPPSSTGQASLSMHYNARS